MDGKLVMGIVVVFTFVTGLQAEGTLRCYVCYNCSYTSWGQEQCTGSCVKDIVKQTIQRGGESVSSVVNRFCSSSRKESDCSTWTCYCNTDLCNAYYNRATVTNAAASILLVVTCVLVSTKTIKIV